MRYGPVQEQQAPVLTILGRLVDIGAEARTAARAMTLAAQGRGTEGASTSSATYKLSEVRALPPLARSRFLRAWRKLKGDEAPATVAIPASAAVASSADIALLLPSPGTRNP